MDKKRKAKDAERSTGLQTRPRRPGLTSRVFALVLLLTGGTGCVYEYSLKDAVDSDTESASSTSSGDTSDDCSNGAKTTGVAGTTWVAICGGTFKMGSNREDENERPVHDVDVPSFEILETEVTVAHFGACVAAQSCAEPQTGGAGANWGVADREEYPINNVTWNQATQFCAWAGGGLPSEAQWEYAASNGAFEDEFPWGDDPATCAYAIMDDGGDGCGVESSWPVCSRPGGNSSHGLCDMAGNLWEWVQDGYHSSYIGAPTDGSAWEAPSGTTRVRRGGGFFNTAGGVRATNRDADVPSFHDDFLGFRCAR